jgi:hypothetical protein
LQFWFDGLRFRFEILVCLIKNGQSGTTRTRKCRGVGHSKMQFFQMVRSIWLPTNQALGISMACGVGGGAFVAQLADGHVGAPCFAGLVCFGCQHTVLAALRWHEEHVHRYSDEVCDDRRALSLHLFCLPGAAVCTIIVWFCSLL